jgi:ABC-type multidrug transport system ATPase subunit
VNLICRFYDVTEGQIRLDGVDVRDLPMDQLRRHVGVVLQEPFLFRGTIWDNLVYGEPTATREQAITAAKAAQAHDFILRSPLGYDTWLGERGAGLSGGERQRLSIARALLYDPRVLILDEATSSVDTESEQALQDALRELTRGRTTIAIAHRLTTLRDAHRILVFDHGKLIEQGSHAELMRLDGHYAKLVKIQTQLSTDTSLDRIFSQPLDTPGVSPPKSVDDPLTPPDDADRVAYQPRWLDASTTSFERNIHGGLTLRDATDARHPGVFAVRLFPASAPDGYVSLRIWDRDGREQELGLIRDLTVWPTEARQLITEALSRRYLLRSIERIESIKLEFGNLSMQVQTSLGDEQVRMRWSQSQVQDFGQNGKILIDLEENRYLVRDVEQLPERDRELFQRYVYW